MSFRGTQRRRLDNRKMSSKCKQHRLDVSIGRTRTSYLLLHLAHRLLALILINAVYAVPARFRQLRAHGHHEYLAHEHLSQAHEYLFNAMLLRPFYVVLPMMLMTVMANSSDPAKLHCLSASRWSWQCVPSQPLCRVASNTWRCTVVVQQLACHLRPLRLHVYIVYTIHLLLYAQPFCSIFTARRYASAVSAVVVCLSVCLCVCSSVSRSQVSIVSKRLSTGSCDHANYATR